MTTLNLWNGAPVVAAGEVASALPPIGSFAQYCREAAGFDPSGSNQEAPDAAIVQIIAHFVNPEHGETVAVYVWHYLADDQPAILTAIDYANSACFEAINRHVDPDEYSTAQKAAYYNNELRRDSASKNEPEPRQAEEILQHAADIIAQRGKSYDNGQGRERSFDKIADTFSTLKGKAFTAMDVIDLLLVLKLVRAQSDQGLDSRHDLVGYAALSSEYDEHAKIG